MFDFFKKKQEKPVRKNDPFLETEFVIEHETGYLIDVRHAEPRRLRRIKPASSFYMGSCGITTRYVDESTIWFRKEHAPKWEVKIVDTTRPDGKGLYVERVSYESRIDKVIEVDKNGVEVKKKK